MGAGVSESGAPTEADCEQAQDEREQRRRIEVGVARLLEQMAALGGVWNGDSVCEPVRGRPPADEQPRK